MKKRIFLSVGEPSGDFLAARLMRALKAKYPRQLTFHGVGGAQMASEGLQSLFPISDLAVMGLVEVLPHVMTIRRRINQTVQAIAEVNPDVIITVDSPGFNFRVGKAVKKRGGISAPLIHYVAPSVWAWRSGRAAKVAQFLDHLLTVFPFEPSFFEVHSLPTTFVGHPVTELDFTKLHGFRQHYGIGPEEKVLCLLPGSRQRELGYLLPVFADVVSRLSGVRIVVPTLDHLARQLREALPSSVIITTSLEEKYGAFRESTAALAASGTVSLELAAAGLPMVIAYKMNPLTHAIIRRMVKVEHACLVNILLNDEIVPEFIQSKCTADAVTPAILNLLDQPSVRAAQTLHLSAAIERLRPPPAFLSPSECAASVIGQYLELGKKKSA